MSERLPLVVMYHYVWPDDKEVPGGIRPLLVSEFTRQLDWLGQRYKIVTPDTFLARYRTPVERPCCLLTFDDGTRDHAEVVAPLLVHAASVAFSSSLRGRRHGLMPLTHLLHWLLGQDPQTVWNAFQDYAREHLGGLESLGAESEARRIYHYESPLRARIKYAANMALPAEHTQAGASGAGEGTGCTTRDLAAEWFAVAGATAAMHRAGMTLGMHGVSHRSLQLLGCRGSLRRSTAVTIYLRG